MTILRYYPIFILFAASLIIALLKKNSIRFAASETYLVLNIILFIVVSLLFIYYLIRILKKEYPFFRSWTDWIFFTFIVIASFYTVYFLFSSNVTGRMSMINIFLKDIFVLTNPFFLNRTYSYVLPSLLNHLFNVSLTPELLLSINRIFASVFLVVAALISRLLFRRWFYSVLSLIVLVSSVAMQYNFSSIEHGVGALLFVYLSILLLFVYQKNEDEKYLVMSMLALVLATLYRYELSFLFGFPYFLYITIFMYPYKKIRKYLIIFIPILILRLVSIISHYIYNKDPYLTGGFVEGIGITPILKNSAYVLYENIILEKHFFLGSGFVSVFTYIGIIASSVLIISLFLNQQALKTRRKMPFFLLAFFSLFYIIFQVSFHIEGLSSGIKYSVFYLFCHIALTFFAVSRIAKKFFPTSSLRDFSEFLFGTRKKSDAVLHAVTYIIIVFVIILAVKTSESLSYRFINDDNPSVEPRYLEMLHIKNAMIDKECIIVLVSDFQPLIHHYLGLQDSTISFGSPPDFYKKLREFNKSGKCFYYYKEKIKLFTDNKSVKRVRGTFYAEYTTINNDKVDKIFSSCNRSVIYRVPMNISHDGNFLEFKNNLIKYSCSA